MLGRIAGGVNLFGRLAQLEEQVTFNHGGTGSSQKFQLVIRCLGTLGVGGWKPSRSQKPSSKACNWSEDHLILAIEYAYKIYITLTLDLYLVKHH